MLNQMPWEFPMKQQINARTVYSSQYPVTQLFHLSLVYVVPDRCVELHQHSQGTWRKRRFSLSKTPSSSSRHVLDTRTDAREEQKQNMDIAFAFFGQNMTIEQVRHTGMPRICLPAHLSEKGHILEHLWTKILREGKTCPSRVHDGNHKRTPIKTHSKPI